MKAFWDLFKRDVVTTAGRNVNKIRKMSQFSNLKFDNLALKTLPLDADTSNTTRSVPGACFSLVDPTPVEKPQLVACSKNALALLDITEDDIESDDFAEYFCGNKLLPGSKTAAHCYCGHQFGHFSGQLGDGATMYLGEILNSKGERWELQLKGAGKTPYSRHADGRKVLRSSIREFLCSEAMHSLGIPTTRAGTCVTSDSRVVRDIHYDGNPIMERCTIVSRIAPTFLRFGSFEIFKDIDNTTGRKGPSVGRTDILNTMLDYVTKTFYPEIDSKYGEDKKACYFEFYKEVVRRTAKLAAMWQCVGFCHGVLNTDNMSIMGLTIDYGPYGFMDYFDPGFICNASDNQGRYSYIKQPEICKWNLLKFAEALKEALPLDEMKVALNEIYDTEFANHYYSTMKSKLGLKPCECGNDDEKLVQKLLWTMHQTSADFTNTFRILSSFNLSEEGESLVLEKILSYCQNIEGVKKRVKPSANIVQFKTLLQLADAHPGLMEQLGVTKEELEAIIEKSEKDLEVTKLTQTEKSSRDRQLWNDWLNLYKERIKLDVKDKKDDAELQKFMDDRKVAMDAVNPCFVLRNYMAQEAIQAAEEGDFSKVQDLLKLLENPYQDVHEKEEVKMEELEVKSDKSEELNIPAKYCGVAPKWAADLRVS